MEDTENSEIQKYAVGAAMWCLLLTVFFKTAIRQTRVMSLPSAYSGGLTTDQEVRLKDLPMLTLMPIADVGLADI